MVVWCCKVRREVICEGVFESIDKSREESWKYFYDGMFCFVVLDES